MVEIYNSQNVYKKYRYMTNDKLSEIGSIDYFPKIGVAPSSSPTGWYWCALGRSGWCDTEAEARACVRKECNIQ